MSEWEIRASAPVAEAAAVPMATVVSAQDVSPPPERGPASRKPVGALMDGLAKLGLPPGICEQFIESANTFALRYWIVDNSGSMSLGDGHRLTKSGGREGFVSCSRWEELSESISFVAKAAIELGAPTEFRLLNPPMSGVPQIVRVGMGKNVEELRQIEALTRSPPAGGTPLCTAIRKVVHDIQSRSDYLLSTGLRAAIIIASDGEASDGDCATALQPLRRLPCWVVTRLCTDDDSVVQYWNSIDEQVELDMDVLDDLTGEAHEVTAHSNFLTYGIPLHRLREFGTSLKLIDVLDERPLKPHEIADLVGLILGSSLKASLPHPELAPKDFALALHRLQSKLPLVWDPIRRTRKPWFDIKKMSHAIGSKAGCALM